MKTQEKQKKIDSINLDEVVFLLEDLQTHLEKQSDETSQKWSLAVGALIDRNTDLEKALYEVNKSCDELKNFIGIWL